ncbi:radical SAM protein [Salipaludibacillus sp. HK11]|uniref:radical SAM protein n=1 Tax=Salipaludibacillus sp. HK11 TaxID=3394320 RepID=UPI0039FD8EA7
MNYIILSKYSVVTFGNNGSLLYDINNKVFYSLDIDHTNILKQIKKGTQIDEIRKKFDNNLVSDFITKLLNNNLASLSDTFYVEEEFRTGNAMASTNLDFTTCYIEFPTDCNEGCTNCKEPKIFSCLACCKPDNISQQIDVSFYENLLKDLLKTSVNLLVFHGGDPLTNYYEVLEIIKYTRNKADQKVKIILKTNGSLINEEISMFLIKYKINPLINFNNMNEQDFEGRIKKLKTHLTEFNHNNLDYYCNIVFESPSLNYNNHCVDKLKSLGFKNITISYTIDLKENLQQYASVNFPQKLVYNFNFYKELHPCLNGTLAITSDKKVIPCPALKQSELLDLSKDNFINVFNSQDKISELWRLTLQKIDKCKSCKFKYSCSDCRAIEEILSNQHLKKEICYLGF